MRGELVQGHLVKWPDNSAMHNYLVSYTYLMSGFFFVMADSVTLENHVHYLKGLPVPPKVSQHQIYSLKDVELYPDDIWGAQMWYYVLGCVRSILVTHEKLMK